MGLLDGVTDNSLYKPRTKEPYVKVEFVHRQILEDHVFKHSYMDLILQRYPDLPYRQIVRYICDALPNRFIESMNTKKVKNIVTESRSSSVYVEFDDSYELAIYIKTDYVRLVYFNDKELALYDDKISL